MAMQTTAIQEDKGNGIFHKAMNSESKPVWIPGPVIIGAGPSGLAVAACLKERGVPFLILEKERCIGSLWTLKTYNSLQLHLPKETCKLPHMPFPPEVPAYPTKQQFISYLEAYAKHFAIEPMFRQEVQSAIYDARMGFWRVQSNESEFLCRWFIVATGENAEPVLPNIEGISDFKGSLIHTSRFKDGADFTGQKVLVVGCGNSGMEISLDLCNNDAQVSLAVRDKLHILPREVLGRSTFSLSMWLLNWFPVKLVDWFLLICSQLILGDTQKMGIRRPKIGPLEQKNSTGKTPVLDVGAFSKIKSGKIKVVCGVQRFTASGAEFVDGHVENFDSVILATGYRSTVTSWLKEDNFFNENDGYPRNPFPDNWKGKNGLYSVGFTRRGLLGSSIDAHRVAEDIARQWNCETKHLRIES
ncbi:PREDICTED: indole-3-pyruvate monooxygenase YUCCA6-like [Populus euphratica]|uniref:indole-3-pyruvate monooxygenase n=1 Tax=Populus euphratica TaxID=75702 RepID=A0AAJ6XNS7_POPEU|nr:PREDICTED: indole-3-pyruvate monooxygenase YUCCA6-like [Populus euphratica]